MNQVHPLHGFWNYSSEVGYILSTEQKKKPYFGLITLRPLRRVEINLPQILQDFYQTIDNKTDALPVLDQFINFCATKDYSIYDIQVQPQIRKGHLEQGKKYFENYSEIQNLLNEEQDFHKKYSLSENVRFATDVSPSYKFCQEMYELHQKLSHYSEFLGYKYQPKNSVIFIRSVQQAILTASENKKIPLDPSTYLCMYSNQKYVESKYQLLYNYPWLTSEMITLDFKRVLFLNYITDQGRDTSLQGMDNTEYLAERTKQFVHGLIDFQTLMELGYIHDGQNHDQKRRRVDFSNGNWRIRTTVDEQNKCRLGSDQLLVVEGCDSNGTTRRLRGLILEGIGVIFHHNLDPFPIHIESYLHDKQHLIYTNILQFIEKAMSTIVLQWGNILKATPQEARQVVI